MRFNALRKPGYLSASKYDFVTVTSAAGVTTRNYSPDGTVEFFGGLSFGSNLIVYTNVPMKLFTQLDNLADKNGVQAMPAEGLPRGAVYEVRAIQPCMTAWAFVEGYKCTLVRVD